MSRVISLLPADLGRPIGCVGRLGDAAPPPERPLGDRWARRGRRHAVVAVDRAAAGARRPARAGARSGPGASARIFTLRAGPIPPPMPLPWRGWRSGRYARYSPVVAIDPAGRASDRRDPALRISSAASPGASRRAARAPDGGTPRARALLSPGPSASPMHSPRFGPRSAMIVAVPARPTPVVASLPLAALRLDPTLVEAPAPARLRGACADLAATPRRTFGAAFRLRARPPARPDVPDASPNRSSPIRWPELIQVRHAFAEPDRPRRRPLGAL